MFLYRTAWAEEKLIAVRGEESFEKLLSLRADGDDAGLPTVGVLVMGRLVHPRLPARVDVASADAARFSGSAPCQALELHQPSNVAIEERKRGVDGGIGHRSDRFGFPRCGASSLQASDGGERLINGSRHQFFRSGPFENPADTFDLLVDGAAAPFLINETLPNCFECQRAEGHCKCVSV
jgi:hypothetical protein